MKKIFTLASILCLLSINSLQAGSVSNYWDSITNKEYNLLIAPKIIVVNSSDKETKKTINEIYKKVIKELMHKIEMKKIQFNVKIFTKKGSNLKQYKKQDIQSYEILKDMLNAQTILYRNSDITIKENPKEEDDDFDLSEDDLEEITFDTQDKAPQINPSEVFISNFVELSELYNIQVLELNKVQHPFRVKGKPVMKIVNAVLGLNFTQVGENTVETLIVVCKIDKDSGDVQVFIKKIPAIDIVNTDFKLNAEINKALEQIIVNSL